MHLFLLLSERSCTTFQIRKRRRLIGEYLSSDQLGFLAPISLVVFLVSFLDKSFVKLLRLRRVLSRSQKGSPNKKRSLSHFAVGIKVSSLATFDEQTHESKD